MEESLRKKIRNAFRLVNFVFTLIIIVSSGMIYYQINPDFIDFGQKSSPLVGMHIEEDRDRIVDGIHVRTGLIDAEGMFLVVNNCTNCHSAKLVTQNRMNAERWNETIIWMQETQNLWDLGESQEIIVNYLVTNYPLKKTNGRRTTLTNIDWYDLAD